jgi:hypothetical protein
MVHIDSQTKQNPNSIKFFSFPTECPKDFVYKPKRLISDLEITEIRSTSTKAMGDEEENKGSEFDRNRWLEEGR